MSKLSTQPYKGSRDFFPKDMTVRNYIFNTWKKVCESYGYEEYDGPFIEPFELYAEKTGEEIVNEQLYSFEDRGNRKVAIRPEMTPTLARMIASKHKILPKPIKWFSIPNLWRYEKPQRGRLREHFQLNVDIFGVDGIEADYEVISLATDIMNEFGATNNMYEIKIGNRRLIDDVLNSYDFSNVEKYTTGKALDKKSKISEEEFENLLIKKANLHKAKIDKLNNFLKNPLPTVEDLVKKGSLGANEVLDLLKLFRDSEKEYLVTYDPTVMRGFDYYTGNVFEQFDKSPENNRSMYGGGRYDDLLRLFGNEVLTGIGFGMGDVTLKNFLEDWNLLPAFKSNTEVLVTVWPGENKKFFKTSSELAKSLRNLGYATELWLFNNSKLDKQLKYADKKTIRNVVIIGEEELNSNTVTIKDMSTGTQKNVSIEDLPEHIS